MTTISDRQSATIYQFPKGGRAALGGRRDQVKAVEQCCGAAHRQGRFRRRLVSRRGGAEGRTRPQDVTLRAARCRRAHPNIRRADS